jgi:predicted kinase
MSMPEFGPDERGIPLLARPLGELKGYEEEDLIAKADMIGLTPADCQRFYYSLRNQLVTATPDGYSAALLREIAQRSRRIMKARWEASGQRTTKSQYSDRTGRYTEERQTIHDEIITQELSRVPVRVGKRPTWLILAGAAGSGKSTVVRELQGKYGASVLTDPDGIREELLPDAVEDPIQTQMSHDEAGDISDKLLGAALGSGRSIISETTLRDMRWIDRYFKEALMREYDVNMVYLHTQFPISFGNALLRATRPIPPDVLLSCVSGQKNLLSMGWRRSYFSSVSVIETAHGKGESLDVMRKDPNSPIKSDIQRHIRQFQGIL